MSHAYIDKNAIYKSTFLYWCVYADVCVLNSSFELKSERYSCLFQRKNIYYFFSVHTEYSDSVTETLATVLL